jgi:putative DNA primase/helicase
MNEHEQIKAALAYVPAGDRALWLWIGMAIKSELGEEGFDLWDNWSQQDESYRETHARDAWKSIRADGRVTAGTLYYEAQTRGFKFNREHRPRVTAPEEQTPRTREIEQVNADELKRKTEARERAERI